MVLLAQLDNIRAAQGFIDYLKTQNINAKLVQGEQKAAAILINETDQPQAQALWLEFEKEPNQDKYLAASWDTGTHNAPFLYSGSSLNLKQRFSQLSWLNQGVTLLSIVIYIVFMFGGFNTLFSILQFKPNNPISWITPAIIHFSAIHIIFNLMWWMQLGHQIEKSLGKLTLLVIFLLSAIVSNWAQYLLVGPNFGGLSGVVYALLGFSWIYAWLKPDAGIVITKAIVGFMLVWMLLGFADVLFVGMANWAHLFGLLTGMAFAFLKVKSKK
ncbi:rhomboid family intramembrane serine protease GlpG [Pseudoalteromonas denitrificans]|jgi:GlpG protein|uniref:GlpG protein n=1 Tax=Pseudoalteromonas denitrificans DSM 6059 TaxID=1123010 RepID=A0A1I1E1A2_9GAMM|nr:rhomboid family intramembrane serine protease GlpG [Pseudoalteromonas denitrificans]SFB78750.1 GlpG protein [Pseudoalteromonas denitrificans DSM 6059]